MQILKLISMILAFAVSVTLCQGQTESDSKGEGIFPYSTKECPPIGQVAKEQWTPEALLDYQNKLAKCENSSRAITINKQQSITLVQYLYHFKEDSKFTSKQQFNFIINNSNNHIIWSNYADYPTGALEDVRLNLLDGHPILEFEFFTGGTAGYWEEYFAFAGGELSQVGSNYEESANSLIPAGYSARRTRADLKALTAVIYLATENDANCCPSGRLDLKLGYKANNLFLVSGKFAAN